MKAELYKTANAQTSFICEAMLGRVYNKIGLVLVLRDGKNKAVKTLSYYLDIPAAKVLFHDIWENKLLDEYKEYKKTPKIERGLAITPQQQGGYRVFIMNTVDNREKDKLYFQIANHQARQMAITVLDYLRSYEIGTMIRELIKRNKMEEEQNG